MVEPTNKLKVVLPSLQAFYAECDRPEDYCNMDVYQDNLEERCFFKGLSNKEIDLHKYSYTKGLDQLKKIEGDVNVGGTRHKYKWNDFDGDDMDFGRYTEGMSPMKQRIRQCGIGSGRFITIHVNLSEFGGTDAEEMMYKAYTAIRIIDFLEELGYRCGLTVYDETSNLGTTKDGKYIDYILVEIPVKFPQDPLIRSLILTTVSPWMERHHIFKFHSAKFNCSYGMGGAVDSRLKDTTTDIYIRQGECLNEIDANTRIDALIKQFAK